MRRAVLAALAAFALGLFPAGASAATQQVNVLFQAFSPTPLDVLPGETVDWSNVSDRRHTVTADNGSFDSGDLEGGQHFSQTFTSVGAYAYHCTVHAGMTGEVDVRRVTLAALPPAAVPAGKSVEFEGRTADPALPVTIERNTSSGFRPAGTATPAADGTWRTTLMAQQTGDYRAAVGADTSQTRRLLVSNRKVRIRATRHGVAVSVTPAVPYARITLDVYRRDRFGWWPAVRTRLDYVSSASFRVKRPARVRAALVARDGWTPLATSRTLTLGHPPRMRMTPHHAGH
jgi:plastocyanin